MRPIDSDVLKFAVANYLNTNAYLNSSASDVLKMILRWIDETDTLDVAPVVHGRRLYPAGSKAVSSATCSVCRRRIKFGEYRFYCPACNAKMDGDDR